MILCTVIAILTVYFVLDVFGIITVPTKYSIASLFYYSQVPGYVNAHSPAARYSTA